jgi:hypothetical protein
MQKLFYKVPGKMPIVIFGLIGLFFMFSINIQEWACLVIGGASFFMGLVISFCAHS